MLSLNVKEDDLYEEDGELSMLTKQKSTSNVSMGELLYPSFN